MAGNGERLRVRRGPAERISRSAELCGCCLKRTGWYRTQQYYSILAPEFQRHSERLKVIIVSQLDRYAQLASMLQDMEQDKKG